MQSFYWYGPAKLAGSIEPVSHPQIRVQAMIQGGKKRLVPVGKFAVVNKLQKGSDILHTQHGIVYVHG
jgi:hypothetical protein